MSVIEPEQIWWSPTDLAISGLPDLPGSVQGINHLANMGGWRQDPALSRRKVGRGGGWQYHWSALPLAARQRLLKDAAEVMPEAKTALPRGEAWARYDALSAAAKAKAKEQLKALDQVEAFARSGVTHVVAVTEAAQVAKVSPRSIYNWLERIEGVAREDRLAYLAPRNKSAKRKSVKATCSVAFMDHLKGLYLRLEGPSFADSYRRAVKKAKKEGWDTLKLATAKRHLEADVPRVTRVFAREGEAGLTRCYPPQIRDKSMMTAMEGVNADCHKIDIFVRWPDGTVNRPQIVGFQDIYSGKILSWRVDHTPNKVMVAAAFGEMIDDWGIPKHCLYDNGREFANKWFTGGTKTRFRFKIREEDPVGVLPLMGIQVHWAKPAHGQAKPVERAFRDFANVIAKDPRFEGAYVGNRPDAKPENYGNRAIPVDEFIAVLAEGVEEHNAREGRLSPTARGRSFDQTFAESYTKAPIRKASEAQRRLWLMGQHVGKLHKNHGSLRVHGNEYHSAWMSQRAGETVVARFDPEDLHAGVHIETTTGEYLGFGECRQKVGFFDLVGAQEEARRRRQIKKAEKALLDAKRPVTIEQIAAEMPIESLPKETVEAKVVAPEFGRPKSAPIIRPPVYQAPENPELDTAHEALILELSDRRNDKPKPTPSGFTVADTAEDRFRQAQEIIERSDKGQAVGQEEADWVRGYMRTPEYQGALVMSQFLDQGGAG